MERWLTVLKVSMRLMCLVHLLWKWFDYFYIGFCACIFKIFFLSLCTFYRMATIHFTLPGTHANGHPPLSRDFLCSIMEFSSFYLQSRDALMHMFSCTLLNIFLQAIFHTVELLYGHSHEKRYEC